VKKRTQLLLTFGLASWLLAAQQPAAAPAKAAAVPLLMEELKFPPLRDLKLPKSKKPPRERHESLHAGDHELPLVSGSALIRTGNLFDPADKVGLASVTATPCAVVAPQS